MHIHATSNPFPTALQSPIEYQRKEGVISVTRPLSSGRPPSAPPTPNGHATQPPPDSEQEDQVWIPPFTFLVYHKFLKNFLTSDHMTFDPSGTGSGAAGLRGGAGGWDLCVSGGEGSDSGVQPAGSESGLSAGQQRFASRRGLGATQRAQHTLTFTHEQTHTGSRVRIWFTISTYTNTITALQILNAKWVKSMLGNICAAKR